MTGLTRQQAAEAVAALFGTTATHSRSSRTYDPWEVTDNEGKTWRFVFDASIRATHRSGRRQLSTGDDTYKVEMNSPKLEYSEMGKLQEVVRALRHAGAVVNSSCGMHVHVDASKHTPQSLKNALSIMYSKEDILFKALNVAAHQHHHGPPQAGMVRGRRWQLRALQLDPVLRFEPSFGVLSRHIGVALF